MADAETTEKVSITYVLRMKMNAIVSPVSFRPYKIQNPGCEKQILFRVITFDYPSQENIHDQKNCPCSYWHTDAVRAFRTV